MTPLLPFSWAATAAAAAAFLLPRVRDRHAAIHCCASACRRLTLTSRAAASACAATAAARDTGALPLLPAAARAGSFLPSSELNISRPSRSRTWLMVGLSACTVGSGVRMGTGSSHSPRVISYRKVTLVALAAALTAAAAQRRRQQQQWQQQRQRQQQQQASYEPSPPALATHICQGLDVVHHLADAGGRHALHRAADGAHRAASGLRRLAHPLQQCGEHAGGVHGIRRLAVREGVHAQAAAAHRLHKMAGWLLQFNWQVQAWLPEALLVCLPHLYGLLHGFNHHPS